MSATTFQAGMQPKTSTLTGQGGFDVTDGGVNTFSGGGGTELASRGGYETAAVGPLAKAPGARPAPAVARGVSRGPVGFNNLLGHARKSGVVGAAGFVLSAALSTAEAADHPRFDGTSVYCVGTCPFNERQLEAELAKLNLPVYVIYFSNYDGGYNEDRGAWLKANADATIDAWQRTGNFDAGYATVISRLWDERHLDPADSPPGVSRAIDVTHASEVYKSTGKAALDDRHTRMQDDHFFPKWENNRDYLGAFAEYAAAVDRYNVGIIGLDTIRGKIDALITDAETLAQDPLVTGSQAKNLEEAVAAAKAVRFGMEGGLTEYQIGDLSAAYEALNKSVTEVKSGVEKQKTAAAELAGSISSVEAALASPEATAKDKTQAIEAALVKARRVREANDYAAMPQAKRELEAAAKSLLSEIPSRESDRKSLKAALVRAETVSQSGDLESGDDVSTIREAIQQSEKLKDSHDYAAMRAATATLSSEAARLEGVVKVHQEHKRALAETRGKTETVAKEIERVIRDSAEYLEGEDTTPYTRAVADAREAAQDDNLETMRATLKQAETRRDELKALVDKKETEAMTEALVKGLIALGAIGATGLVGTIGVVSLVRYQRRRKELLERLQKWEAEITQAETTFSKIVMVQEEKAGDQLGDGLPALIGQIAKEKLKDKSLREILAGTEGKTKEIYGDFQNRETELKRGLDRIKKHVQATKQIVESSNWMSRKKLDEAEANLSRLEEKTVQFDTNGLPEELVSADQKTVTVNPQALWQEIKDSYQPLRAQWITLMNAVVAMNETAEKDLSRELLDDLTAQAQAAGIPVAWLERHPLYANADNTWKELNELRKKDPVSYVEDVLKKEQEEKDVAAKVAGAIAIMKELQAAESRAAAISVDFDATVLDNAEAQDPRALEAALRRERAELTQILDASRELDDIEKEAHDVIAIFDEIAIRKQTILDAVRDAESRIATSRGEIAGIEEKLAAANARYGKLLNQDRHAPESLVAARSEIAQIEEDLAKARRTLGEAEALFAVKRHLAAIAKSAEVSQYCKNAQADVDDFGREAAGLEKAKADFDAAYNAMTATRADKVSAMGAYGQYAETALFAKGDALLSGLVEEYAKGAARDFAAENRRLAGVVAAWDRAIEIVDNRRDVGNAAANVALLDAKLATAVAMAEGIMAYHSANNVQRLHAEIREAESDIARAKEALQEAQRILAGGDDKAAEQAAFRAADLCKSAVKNIEDISHLAQELEGARRQYQAELQRLQSQRNAYLSNLRGYSYASGYDLSRGDGLYQSLPSSHALDWALQYAQLRAIEQAWQASVESARRVHEAEVHRLAEIARREREEAERRAREAARRERERREAQEAAERAAEARRRSSYSSSSSSSSRSSWGSSSSSSSRSSSSSSRSSTTRSSSSSSSSRSSTTRRR